MKPLGALDRVAHALFAAGRTHSSDANRNGDAILNGT